MLVSAIAAMSSNRVIGANNQIPWHLPADLRFFKETTTGHFVIMGRKNYESIGKPLPKRTNVLITRNPYFISSGCCVVHSIPEALKLAAEGDEKEAFIIGGGEIYKQAMPLTERIYLTEIHEEFEGDVFFPEFDESRWSLQLEQFHEPDEKNKHAFTIKIFHRIAPDPV